MATRVTPWEAATPPFRDLTGMHRNRRWLSPPEPDNGNHGVRTTRVDGIGDWLLEAGELQAWKRWGG